jgi:hypothetical protein
MFKIVEVKTPLGLQTLIWKDGALARPEDLAVAEVIDIRVRLEQLKPLPTTQSGDLEALPNLRPMWGLSRVEMLDWEALQR